MREIILERLPATVGSLRAMPQAVLTVPEEVAALTITALARFPENRRMHPDAGFLMTETVKWNR